MRAGLAVTAALVLGAAGALPSARGFIQPERDVLEALRAVADRIDATARDLVRSARGAVEPAPLPVGLRLYRAAPSPGAPSPGAPGPAAPWAALPAALPERVVLLVHGLDEPGTIWDDLAPRLAGAGHAVVRFDYPNDQAAAKSASMLAGALRDVRTRGAARVDIVAHSMGGLLARDVLTDPEVYAGRAIGHAALPDVPRLIMFGTPHHGSPWAKARVLAEMRERIDRFARDPDRDLRLLIGALTEGAGAAGDDLLPGSPYLTRLGSRPLPEGVRMTLVIGRLAPDDSAPIIAATRLREILGPADAAALQAFLDSQSRELGDGVVPVSSAELAGVDDRVYVDVSHRGMLQMTAVESLYRDATGQNRVEPPGIAIVLDRLGRE